MNKRKPTSQATSNTSNSNFIPDIPHLSEASSSEDEDIGIHKCGKKIHAEIINEEVKREISEEVDIGIHKCMRIIRVYIITRN